MTTSWLNTLSEDGFFWHVCPLESIEEIQKTGFLLPPKYKIGYAGYCTCVQERICLYFNKLGTRASQIRSENLPFALVKVRANLDSSKVRCAEDFFWFNFTMYLLGKCHLDEHTFVIPVNEYFGAHELVHFKLAHEQFIKELTTAMHYKTRLAALQIQKLAKDTGLKMAKLLVSRLSSSDVKTAISSKHSFSFAYEADSLSIAEVIVDVFD